MTPDLSVKLGSLELQNPVLTASGTFGYGEEFSDFVDLDRLGGFIVKGTTLAPREGNPYPRMAETPSGMLNAVGLQNKGVDYFIEHIYPRLRGYRSEVIVNVSGACVDDYAEVCRRLADLDEIHAVEVNISCPNVKHGGMAFGTTTAGASEVVSAVRKAWPGHLMVKLSPNVTDITEIARAAEASGADSLSLINTVTGGLSGPAVKPVAVRMVWQTAKAVNIPIVGLGGIRTGDDALEFIMAGATAVQVGTANFLDPATTMRVIDRLNEYCVRHNVSNINSLRGII